VFFLLNDTESVRLALVRDQGVGGSNPLSPTIYKPPRRPWASIASDAGSHLLLRGILNASEIPKISFVSQPVGRLTDCNK
jgi:hypothetical protein